MEELLADIGSAQGLSADRASVGCLRSKPIAICASQTDSMTVKRLDEEVSLIRNSFPAGQRRQLACTQSLLLALSAERRTPACCSSSFAP